MVYKEEIEVMARGKETEMVMGRVETAMPMAGDIGKVETGMEVVAMAEMMATGGDMAMVEPKAVVMVTKAIMEGEEVEVERAMLKVVMEEVEMVVWVIKTAVTEMVVVEPMVVATVVAVKVEGIAAELLPGTAVEVPPPVLRKRQKLAWVM